MTFTINALSQTAIFLLVLWAFAWPLGIYMARVYSDRPFGLDKVLGPIEKLIYRLCGVDRQKEMSWKSYVLALLVFAAASLILLYFLQRLQAVLPLNPTNAPVPAPDLAFNTAASFIANTNWQAYSGESAMSYLTQMLGLTVQSFASAATGMAVAAAFIRSLSRRESATVGNFWQDLLRSVLYILLPLSFIMALILVWQGVPQTTAGPLLIQAQDGITLSADNADGPPLTVQGNLQEIARGPVASQETIKLLGTNGGGFFNANSAHPFENPTPLTNFLEMLAILIIPAGFCVTLGIMVLNRRHGLIVLLTMTIIFSTMAILAMINEQYNGPAPLAGVSAEALAAPEAQAGGNMEGKETRFGVVNSALFAVVTTSASCGAVNSMHDSYTPLGGLIPLALIQCGEVVFGGVGSGLYGIIIMAMIGVFVAGLMVGRSPEYLGKKIGPFEMKMAAIAILLPPFLSIIGTALTIVINDGAGVGNPGTHGFSEILYAFSSMSNNNGSAFAGLNADQPYYNIVGGVCMLLARFGVAAAVLAIAGSMAAKKITPPSMGTLPVNNLMFVFILIGVIIVVGALTFFPALALGPIAEYLAM